MSEEQVEAKDKKWVIRVTTLIQMNPPKYQNFYIGVKGDKEQAEQMKKVISRKGFQVGGERFFSDSIKSLVIKEDGEILNEQ